MGLRERRGSDCRASYIRARCVMEDFAVNGVDAAALQPQANRQFAKLIASHAMRAFGGPPPERIVRPVFPTRRVTDAAGG